MAERKVTSTLYLDGAPGEEELNPFAIRLGPAAQRATGRKTTAKRKGDKPRNLNVRVKPQAQISAPRQNAPERALSAIGRVSPGAEQALRTVDDEVLGLRELYGAGIRGVADALGGDVYGDGDLQLEDAKTLALAGALGPAFAGAGRLGGAALRRLPAGVRQGASDFAARARRYLTESRAVPETRPAYERATEGPFTVIRRRDAAPQPVPAAQTETSLAALRRLAQDRDSSPAIRAADEAAMEARGTPYDERAPLPISSLQRQAAMGRAYREALSDNPAYKHALFERYGEMMPEVVEQAAAQNYDQLTEAAYRQLGEEVTQQFDRLPLTFRYHEGPGEYGSSTEMIQDALGRGNLNVFSGGEPHEFLSKVDPATGLSQNEMFRAVHDYMGHVVPASRFGPSGEEIAYAAHSQQLSPLAQLALLAETRGQNSLVNYSPLNADLIGQMNALRVQRKERRRLEKALAEGLESAAPKLDDIPTLAAIDARLRELGAQTQYAPQRALLLPPEFVDPMSPGGMPEWARGELSGLSPVSARGVHISKSPELTVTDPSFFGRGHQGSEYAVARRLGSPERTYFYSGPEGMVEPELPVLGAMGGPPRMVRGPRYAYEADLTGLYDLQADPEGLLALARAYGVDDGSTIPNMEHLVRDYGYAGYLSDFGKQRAAAVFDPVSGLRPLGEATIDRRYAEGGAVQGDGNSA